MCNLMPSNCTYLTYLRSILSFASVNSLKDFAAIAQVDIGEEESDDNERELEELIDYLRLAALNILTDALSHQD